MISTIRGDPVLTLATYMQSIDDPDHCLRRPFTIFLYEAVRRHLAKQESLAWPAACNFVQNVAHL